MTNNNQFISAGTDTAPVIDVNQVLDTVQVPVGCTIKAALIGDGTPANDYHGLFLHFAPLHHTKLDSFQDWGRKADVLIEFYEFDMEMAFVHEIARRWPDAQIYNYGCLCCNDGEPILYEN